MNFSGSLRAYAAAFLKWLLLGIAIGLAGGAVGSVFHILIDEVTILRIGNPWLILLLPMGGVAIAGIYALSKKYGSIDTNRVLTAAAEDESVPFVMTPLIFISTIITHLFGGSAGREGAALQLGGSIGYNVGKLFKLSPANLHIIVMTGMSAVFSALFGTPVTAAFFAVEVVCVGVMHYGALFACMVSGLTAFKVAELFGISPVRFQVSLPEALSFMLALKVIALSALCALVSIVFCIAIKKAEHFSEKYIPNPYIRALAGGAVLIILTLLSGTYDYNGAGMAVITRAMGGEAEPLAFALKIIFTAVTISAGFRGGEIVPAFFIGSTFGCVMAAALSLDPALGAAIGFIALFCGVVNCPVASFILSVEVFGEGSLIFALAVGVSYMLSGKESLYSAQKMPCSKLTDYFG